MNIDIGVDIGHLPNEGLKILSTPFHRLHSIISRDSDNSSSCSMEGYLRKQGSFRRNWKTRWFELQMESVHYYVDQTKAESKGAGWNKN